MKYFLFNGVCETRPFMLVLRAQSGSITHGVRESRACADQFTFAHAMFKRSTPRMQNKQRG